MARDRYFYSSLTSKLKIRIENQEFINEQKSKIEEKLTKIQIAKIKIKDYKIETENYIKFLKTLNSKVLKVNKTLLERDVTKQISKYFPKDNFTSHIDLSVDGRGRYIASLKMGKIGKMGEIGRKALTVVHQNGDFMQNHLQVMIYFTLLERNKSRLLLLDEAYANSDETKSADLAETISQMQQGENAIDYIILIEHKRDIVYNIPNANIIELMRIEEENRVIIKGGE